MALLMVALVAGGVAVAVVTSLSPAAALSAPDHLTVNGELRPVGVGPDALRFAWYDHAPSANALQRAYRLFVTDVATGAVVWDSGRVSSSAQSAIRYSGPALAPDTRYAWSVQTWGSRGPGSERAASATFVTGLRDESWKADWIHRTTTDAADARDEYTYARREVSVASSPIVQAVSYASAGQQYELWINGQRADKGQAYNYPDSQYSQATDVTALLHAGAVNAVGLLYHYAGPGKGRPPSAPGAILRLSVLHADASRQTFVTDGGWRVARAAWLAGAERNLQGDLVGFVENIDGRGEAVGWDRPGFDDHQWSAAAVIGPHPVSPFTHLLDSGTRIVEDAMHPSHFTPLPSGGYVVDFGQVMAAVPTVTFLKGSAGHKVTMRAGYLLDGQQVSTQRGTQGTDMSYSYIERAGSQTFHPFDYLGFRYFQIDDPGETLSADQVVGYARHDEMPDVGRATFSSSNHTVDAVFQLALHSALYGAQEQFIDTPTREKGPFVRDGFNQSETVMAAFAEETLSRRALLEFAQSQVRYWPDGRINAIYPTAQGARDIPDFTEIYPEWVWQYYLRTGDRALVAQVYPTLASIAGYVTRALDPATGLVTRLPGGGDSTSDYQYGLVDYPLNMRYGYDMGTAARTTVNLLAVDALRRVAQLGDVADRPEAETRTFDQTASSLAEAVNARLTRPDGIYVDGLEPDGRQSPHASQHANAYALAYGVVPKARRPAVTAYVASAGMAMGPQTVQALLEGLRLGGNPSALVALVSDPAHDGWAKILAEGGSYTWETWQPLDVLGDSMSHGWGATVLPELQSALLGATITSPGAASIDVTPPTAGLTSAMGTIPTERGQVAVSWSHPAGGRLALRLTLPVNMTAAVDVGAGVVHAGSGTSVFNGPAA